MSYLACQDANLSEISEHIPYRGACAFCGGVDARHRLFDVILDRYKSGDDAALLAWDYDLPEAVIELIVSVSTLPRGLSPTSH